MVFLFVEKKRKEQQNQPGDPFGSSARVDSSGPSVAWQSPVSQQPVAKRTVRFTQSCAPSVALKP